jgi:hypothetical protein
VSFENVVEAYYSVIEKWKSETCERQNTFELQLIDPVVVYNRAALHIEERRSSRSDGYTRNMGRLLCVDVLFNVQGLRFGLQGFSLSQGCLLLFRPVPKPPTKPGYL